jgi:hypothetical protein
MNLSGKGDGLPDMGNATDPGHRPFHAEAETRVNEGSILPKVEVPPVSRRIEALLQDPRQQLVIAVLSLGAANDLPISFWCN